MIREVLGEPNSLELALYGVMWSEHCSISPRDPLAPSPTKGPTVVARGERRRHRRGRRHPVAIRIEVKSPVAIEPTRGGDRCRGILRDVFTRVRDARRNGPTVLRRVE